MQMTHDCEPVCKVSVIPVRNDLADEPIVVRRKVPHAGVADGTEPALNVFSFRGTAVVGMNELRRNPTHERKTILELHRSPLCTPA